MKNTTIVAMPVFAASIGPEALWQRAGDKFVASLDLTVDEFMRNVDDDKAIATCFGMIIVTSKFQDRYRCNNDCNVICRKVLMSTSR